MVTLRKKGLNNGYMLQDEGGKPVSIVAPYFIFSEVLEAVSNRKTKCIGKDVVIEE